MAVKGMGGQLTRSAAGAQAKRSGLVAAMQRSSAEQAPTVVQLADLAENPANPAARATEDLTDLAESIREIGIVQALTVVPATDWLEHHPDHREAVGEARYVLMAGHRRRAAALLAGRSDAPIMVRPELASAGLTDVQLHENLHRLALTPLQEARAYAAKVDEGFSQREISRAVKVSQGQVAKRLSLLQLPPEVQAAVDHGWYTVADALDLLKQDAEVIAEVALRVADLTDAETLRTREAEEAEAGLSHAEALASRARSTDQSRAHQLSTIAAEARSFVARRRRQATAEARAEELGAQFVANPSEKFRGREYAHELTAARDIDRHAKKGNLAVAPAANWSGDDQPRYYALAKDNPKEQEETAAAKERAAAERREKKGRSEGHKARVAALAQLAAKKPSAADLREHLVLHVLDAPVYDSQAKKLARKIAIEAGMGPEGTEDYWDWMKAAVADSDPARREHLAWVLVWAAREQQHQYDTNYGGWGARSVAYFEDLQRLAGYEPGEWEQEKLADGRRRLTQAADQSAEDGDGATEEAE